MSKRVKRIIKKYFKEVIKKPLAKLINLYKTGKGDLTYFDHFNFWQKNGFTILPNHFYQPAPDLSSINWKKVMRGSSLLGIEMNDGQQLKLLHEAFPRYRRELKGFKTMTKNVNVQLDPNYYSNNGAFDEIDAFLYYLMIRSLKPKKIVEVGSGWSTKIAAEACLKNNKSDLVSIEPYPQPLLINGFPGLTELIKSKVEDVPLSFFSTLKKGDFLFIDSSHTVKLGGDVNYLFLEVLPRLKRGVYAQVHDILLPEGYPKTWIKDTYRFWTEQYLFHAFMLFNKEFEVVYANTYMSLNYPGEVRKIFGNPMKLGGGSFWIRRK